MNTKILETVMQRRVTRREFLTYVGAAILAVMGIHSLLKSLGVQNRSSTPDHNESNGAYGGLKKH